ncbi:hypothetical protein O181_034068, partial [Austropuccinia psidii MF-1]|nr:hypothetical protein [Austropuccinia psidii MF-1]
SHANTPATPSELEGSKGKGNRHSEGLITAKTWTLIATQRNTKPRNHASIQGKPTLTTCTGKITIINPVVTSKGKFPKAVDRKFVLGTVKETLASKGTSKRTEKACPEPEDLEEDTWDTVVDGKTLSEIIPTLPFTFQFNRNLRTDEWKDMDQLSSGFTPCRNQNISGQESPFFTIPGSFQEKTRIQGKKQDLFQPKAERVRPNDPEAVGLGERSTQEPEIVVHTFRISSPINRNITPTQIEHNVVTLESNLRSDALWLQMSQFSKKTKKKFSELQASHERMKTSTAFMDKIVKALQEGHAQLRKSSEEANKRLNQPQRKVSEVTKKKNSCHNCGSTDHYANSCPKAKKKVYAIEKVPEEESPTEDSESDYIGDAIREQSDEDQDPRMEFLVEYQEETPLEIQDIQLEADMPQDTANKDLCKHTQDAQTFLVTPTTGMAYMHGTATNMTFFIDNAQHPFIIDSGEHCSIVARNYLDHHFPKW